MENGNILFRVKGANGGSENQGRWKREERERSISKRGIEYENIYKEGVNAFF